MKQEKRLDFLLGFLVNEHPDENIKIPGEFAEKRELMRALLNIRPPKPIPDLFIQVQDAFLKGERDRKGVVDWKTFSPCVLHDRLFLWQGDITRLNADAIVNAANAQMLGCFHPGHRCIDNEIHTAAGVLLREECNRIMRAQAHPEQTGQAKITSAYNLPSKYVIHTVGPIVHDVATPKKKRQLQSCYLACLDAAVKKGDIQAIAFCCISTGEYRFPQKEAAQIAIGTVLEWLRVNPVDISIIFNVFKDSDLEVYQTLLNKDKKENLQ